MTQIEKQDNAGQCRTKIEKMGKCRTMKDNAGHKLKNRTMQDKN